MLVVVESGERAGQKADEGGGRAQLRGIVMYGLGPVLGLASGPILARCLGPDGRGQFAAIMSPITLVAAVASFGFPAAVVYFGARSGRLNACYSLCLKFTVVSAIVAYAGMLLYAYPVSHRQGISYAALAVCWFAVVVSAVVQLRRAYWQAAGNWRLLDIERGAAAVARFVAVCALALLFPGAGVLVAGGALVSFLLASSLLFLGRSRSDTGSGAVTTGPVLRYSALASIGAITTVAGSRLDQVLMPATSSGAELGYYAVAVTVAEVPLVLVTLCTRNALPLAAHGQSLRRIMRSIRVYLAALAGVTVCIMGSAAVAVPLVFGSDFAASVAPAILLSVSTVLTGVALLLGTIITGWGRPGLGSVIPASAVVITAAAFAARWGDVTAMDAAYISVGSSFVGALLASVLIVVTRRDQRGRGVE